MIELTILCDNSNDLNQFSTFIPTIQNHLSETKFSSISKAKLKVELDFTNGFQYNILDLPISKFNQEQMAQMIEKLYEKNNLLQQELDNLKNPVTKEENTKELIALVGLYKSNGMSLNKIADKLNEDGYTSNRGNEINKMLVSRLHKKYQQEQKDLLAP